MTATATPETAKPASTAEIATAAITWARTAGEAYATYTTLARHVATHLPASLIAAGFDVNTATDMTEEMRVNLNNMATAFHDLATIASAVSDTRDDILQMAAGFKKKGSARQFKVVA